MSKLHRLTILLLLLLPFSLKAQPVRMDGDSVVFFRLPDSLTTGYLDSARVRSRLEINDYSMLGVQYGVSRIGSTFSPTRETSDMYRGGDFGVVFTHYSRMFGHLPYFGYQVGLFHGYEGYRFKANKETGYIPDISGANKVTMEVVELPFMLHVHYDMPSFKLLGGVGIYGGYRLNIHREGEPGRMDEEIAGSFLDTDRRLEYGLKGGVGLGVVLDPFELHIMLQAKYGWGSYFEPDYYSTYFYRFAYPLNFTLSIGVHYQLTRRSGLTKAELRQAARRAVYGPDGR